MTYIVKYSKEIANKIIELYATGNYSIQDICDEVKIARDTFYLWKNRKSFADALAEAHKKRLDAIGEMAMSGLVILIKGHEYDEITTEYTEGKDGKPKIKSQKKVKKFIMPNPAMVALALTNRKSEDWKHKQSLEHSGPNDGPIQTVTIFQLPDNGRDGK